MLADNSKQGAALQNLELQECIDILELGNRKHLLSNILIELRIADCSSCGNSIRIVKRSNKWICSGFKKKRKGKGGIALHPCERCNFVPVHPAQIQIHHKDRNIDNNAESNLEVLCANCHCLEHYS